MNTVNNSPATKKIPYRDQIKNPLWQKMRLEILKRDDWQCQRCQSKKKTLEVHHLYYLLGLMIWEYPDDALIVLCNDCHKYEGENLNKACNELVLSVKKSGLLTDEIQSLARDYQPRETLLKNLLDNPPF